MLNLAPEQEAVLEKAEKMFALAKSTTSATVIKSAWSARSTKTTK